MPLDVKKIFLFNSGLPEPGKTPLAFSRDLGPWEGNFRGRNIGNGYISHATLRGLFGKPVRLDHEANGWTCKIDDAFVSRINSEYSHFVFVMQDFIRESFAGQPFGRMADLMERLTIPVVPLSLGANALDGFDPALPARLSADQVRFVNVLSHKAASIGVRGAYTADVLNQMGIKNVVVTGCPSFFENGVTPARIKRVAFDPGKVVTTGAYFPHQAPSAPHILQDELFFINAMYLRAPDAAPEAWLDDSSQSRPFDTEALGVTYGLYERAFSGRLKFFSHFDTWRKTTRDGGFCMTVGSRLHAAIQSWNSGVPGVVTNGDARASETCAYHGIPHRPDLRDTSDLRAVYGEIDLDAVKRNYPAGRKTFLDYMRANGIVPEDYDTSGETFVYPDYAQDMGADAAAALSAGYRRTWAYNESLLRAGLDRQSTLKSLTAEVEGQRAALARAAEMEAQRLARAGELEREAATRAGEVVALALRASELETQRRTAEAECQAAVQNAEAAAASLAHSRDEAARGRAEVEALRAAHADELVRLQGAFEQMSALAGAVRSDMAALAAGQDREAALTKVREDVFRSDLASLSSQVVRLVDESRQAREDAAYRTRLETAQQAHAALAVAVNRLLAEAYRRKLIRVPLHLEGDLPAAAAEWAEHIAGALNRPIF